MAERALLKRNLGTFGSLAEFIALDEPECDAARHSFVADAATVAHGLVISGSVASRTVPLPDLLRAHQHHPRAWAATVSM